MLKAKAKAAAVSFHMLPSLHATSFPYHITAELLTVSLQTAAKAKKKAAEAAAAAQAQAEEGSFAANTSTSAARRSAVRGPVVGVAAGRGRPSVIRECCPSQ